ncbi:MAG: class I SAM-dependent methyltransferase [Methylocella sp.]
MQTRISGSALSLRRQALGYLQRRLAGDPVPIRLVLWDGEAFDLAPAPTVTITIRSRAVLRLLLTGNMGRLGDAYAAGDLTVDGPIEDVLRSGLKLADRIGKSAAFSRLAQLAALAARVRRRHSRRADAAAISHHYDVSNDFYGLWLDRNMIYSCAYFRTGSEDIDTAQEQKLEHICRKLRLSPGERLLDIGCGWGGLLRFAALRYGVSGVGVTLSAEQHRFATEWNLAEGLADRVEFRLQDYRDIPGASCFDKIVSVGMYEHVGLANQLLYFQIIARLLKPGGVLLNHGIVVTDAEARAQGPPGGEFIDRHVFPGGELPHVSGLLYEVARSGLEPVDMEDLRPHYAQTLLHWSRRLETHASEACRLAGPERFRVWRVFLPGMALAFDRGWLSVVQVLAYKPLPAAMAPRPWTRGYQYAGVDNPVLTTGCNVA